jgi:hypothetical protein
MQVPPIQQPELQLRLEQLIVQTPPVHDPPAHAEQSVPPTPQSPGVFPGRHGPFGVSQQPPHERPSHTHIPPRQRRPTPHAAPKPQRHPNVVDVMPQLSETSGLQWRHGWP